MNRSSINFLYRSLIAFLICWEAIFVSIAIAQPVDPLRIDRSDPLIPKGYGKRELSSFEKYRIQREMTQLDRNAKDELAQNNINSALSLWYRQLRLSQAIDPKTEVETLGKVGAIFWEENLSEDVRNIGDRLTVIQERETVNGKTSLALLNTLAIAYESVRYLDKAIDIYEQILTVNNSERDKTIDKLGELYLGIFDYDNAALTYQKKLQRNISNEDREVILKTLIDIYDSAGNIDRAIANKQILIKQYSNLNKNNKIPALQIAIASDLETLDRTQKALEVYKKAFELASDSKQIDIAGDALMRIGKLYQKENDFKKAIDTYRKLITVQQQSYNYYGLLNTHDTLGQIYLNLNKKELAKQSFQQALEIATSINYKIEYYRDRLKKLSI